MAQALEKVLGDWITGGLVLVKYGHAVPVSKVRILEAGHPIPDRTGISGAKEIVSLVGQASEKDLVIILLSGGGSALMPLPVEGVTLAQKQRTTQILLKSGASINEINVVRKHLSQIKGGRLLMHAVPASVLTLILSDVLKNPLDIIASGPTAPDPSSYGEAIQILKKYRLWYKLPAPVRRHLHQGQRGMVKETPKPGNSVFKKVHHLIVGDNRVALKAAVQAAKAAGFKTYILTAYLQGEAREMAKLFGSIAHKLHEGPRQSTTKICLLASGETTVTVRGNGLGGRCQEFTLAAALEIAGLPHTTVAAFGTDGTDGPTNAAGAYADGVTTQRAIRRGLSPAKALEHHDAFPFFKTLGQLIMTGPTGTNLNDIYLLLIN
jgi:hydroxypyruvate reductase